MKPSEYDLEDPIVAIATALVPSALGIVRATGTGSIELAAKSFSRPKALLGAPGNALVHGWILGPGSERLDEVMVSVYRAPKSFTGEDSVEITGHGGPATVLAVYRALVASGFRPAERGEFSLRAFANGKADLTKAEAIREIIEAKTDEARSRAADRLAGSLAAEMTAIRDDIMRALAAIEVEIEYPEDEETTSGKLDETLIDGAARRLSALASAWAAERLFQDGARVVLAGKTNAGKSSLFNALLKEDRAIVSDAHGTTRDWLESRADFLGIPVRVFDTAGFRETEDAVEAEGVERSRALAENADVVLYLVDATEGIVGEDAEFLLAHEGSALPLIVVWNKSDRTNAREPTLPANLSGLPVVAVSAKTGSGVQALVAAVSRALLGDACNAAEGTAKGTTRGTRAGAPGSERQKDAIERSQAFLEHALEAAREGFPMDAVAQDLEEALGCIGEITGETSSADVLDAVFSGFCVGK
ncbi:MAG TPA: tRNA uridine-5-carboxymethylaminomethyl(34) synthesis GTPase MnmE [Treponemataceae bacterium]|nr:tRNA uridine-5-carboxymethylaminomethyl(34) synthesis GTPase MnmE [Treponemataceae bacterium]HPS43912.1 tRNA uridine-5-carboxymethylaminomethyl(34) synthesis GTPase MnmE [Treponemataceae bacterium]